MNSAAPGGEGVGLSVVIPAYNEAGRIVERLRAAHAWLAGQVPGTEVVVVDDGSSDGTAGVVERLELPGVRVERLERNRGKGAALRRGVAVTSGRVVLTCDADFSTPISEVAAVFAALEAGADVVIASREHPGTRIPADQNRLRKELGRTFNRCVRLLTGLEFSDTQCGFKGFRGAVARAVYAGARIDGFATDVEVLVIARAQGARVVEIPVEWSHVEQSRVRLLRHPAQMLRDLMRVAVAARLGRYRG